MALDQFIDRKFADKTLATIEQANEIIAEYEEMGIGLTLRSLFYQFVSRDLIANLQSEYKRLGAIINDARLAGLIDWDAIEDKTRSLREYRTYVSPGEATLDLARNYLEDLWKDQPVHAEQWIEKDAALGTIEPVCGRWRLPHMSCRGYMSQSEQYAAGKRLEQAELDGKRVAIIHIGDHDPSGIDMSRDIEERLTMFARLPIEVRRIALNMDQVRRYNPPPNPMKETDSRKAGYFEQFGTRKSWELDALDPKVLDQLVDTEVRSLVDIDIWNISIEREAANRAAMIRAAEDMG